MRRRSKASRRTITHHGSPMLPNTRPDGPVGDTANHADLCPAGAAQGQREQALSSSPTTARRSSGWATPPGSFSTGSTARKRRRYLENRAEQRLHRHPGRGDRGTRRAHRSEPVRPSARWPTSTRRRPAVKDRPGQRLLGPRGLHRRTRRMRSGIFIGFLPTWGRHWNNKTRRGPRSSRRENAEIYGEWLGRRYKRRRPSSGFSAATGRSIMTSRRRSSARWRAGCAKGDGGAHLITFHPPGGARLLEVVPRRGLARLQHAPERPRRRSSPAATTRPARTTTARRSSR